MEFNEWFIKLQDYCLSEYGWTEEEYNQAYWLPYFKDGLSPCDAAEEDLCAHVKSGY